MKPITVLLFLCTTFVFSSVAADQQKKFRTPPADSSLWHSSFNILLKEDADTRKTRKTIEKIMAKEVLDMPLGSFKMHMPISVSTFLPMASYEKTK